MKVEINIEGLVSGDDKRSLCAIFDIEESFKQRKQYDEYYFERVNYEIDINHIDKLADIHYTFKFIGTDLYIECD